MPRPRRSELFDEDNVGIYHCVNRSGRFWAGKYKMARILDETALLAVAIYVDLNPIRAGIAKSPETSRYTSAYDRIHADGSARRSESRGKSASPEAPRRGLRWLQGIRASRRQFSRN